MAESVSETLTAAELSEDAAVLFDNEEMPAEGYMKKLSQAGLFSDAVKFRAHTLSGRECVAWSLSCVRLLQPNPKPAEQDALKAVERWLAEPTEAHRRTCKSAAEIAELATAAGCTAMAVFFSEGSIAPPEREHVPVPPHVAQKISAGAIILGVVSEPKDSEDRFKRCLELKAG